MPKPKITKQTYRAVDKPVDLKPKWYQNLFFWWGLVMILLLGLMTYQAQMNKRDLEKAKLAGQKECLEEQPDLRNIYQTGFNHGSASTTEAIVAQLNAEYKEKQGITVPLQGEDKFLVEEVEPEPCPEVECE